MALSERSLDFLRQSWISSLHPEDLQISSMGGGDINEVYLLRYPGEPAMVLKHHATPPAGMFRVEARGLEHLGTALEQAAVNDIVVPLPAGQDEHHLLISYIPRESPKSGSDRQFGRALGVLHSRTYALQGPGDTGEQSSMVYGADNDNHTSHIPEPLRNQPSADSVSTWPGFFREYRLKPQLMWARDQGYSDGRIEEGMSELLSSLEEILPSRPVAAALHGDLWGGNYFFTTGGKAAIYDPAFYCGHGESDLAMTELFGGFSPDFYRGYREIIPDDGGYARRREIYQLRHLLGHLNLFGMGYYSSVISAISQALRG